MKVCVRSYVRSCVRRFQFMCVRVWYFPVTSTVGQPYYSDVTSCVGWSFISSPFLSLPLSSYPFLSLSCCKPFGPSLRPFGLFLSPFIPASSAYLPSSLLSIHRCLPVFLRHSFSAITAPPVAFLPPTILFSLTAPSPPLRLSPTLTTCISTSNQLTAPLSLYLSLSLSLSLSLFHFLLLSRN